MQPTPAHGAWWPELAVSVPAEARKERFLRALRTVTSMAGRERRTRIVVDCEWRAIRFTILVRLSCTPSHMLVKCAQRRRNLLRASTGTDTAVVQACAPCAGARSCIKARSSSKVMNTVRRRRLVPCCDLEARRKRILPNRILWNISVTG